MFLRVSNDGVKGDFIENNCWRLKQMATFEVDNFFSFFHNISYWKNAGNGENFFCDNFLLKTKRHSQCIISIPAHVAHKDDLCRLKSVQGLEASTFSRNLI